MFYNLFCWFYEIKLKSLFFESNHTFFPSLTKRQNRKIRYCNIGYMRRKFHFLLFLLIGLPVFIAGQQTALKTNALFWATTTPNIGVEVGISHNITIELWGAYNAWKYPDDMKLNLYLLQPEARYWFCERFNRTFVGLHGHYADFNVGGFPDWGFISKNMQDNRYQGYLYGGGISIGHSWILKKRWSLEASLGIGYAHIVYDKYPCAECGTKLKSGRRNYFGPTKASISLIYIIK